MLTLEGKLLEEKQYQDHRLDYLFGRLETYNKGHIKLLYELILPEHAAKIQHIQTAMTALGGKPIRTDFESALASARVNFVRWRYLFEKNTAGDGSNVTILVILRAIRARVLGMHPEWETGQSALMRSFVTGRVSLKSIPFDDSLGVPAHDLNQYIIKASGQNGGCQQQVALVFDMEPGLPFPGHSAGTPPLVAYPKGGTIQCSACHAWVNHKGAQDYVENHSGRKV